ncbi:MAG: putative signal-transduction protein containing cAMP-binding and CBS domain protein [Halonotius sp. J07HN4]|jgi:Predicted signal-transduction protein containing cAMP-binding and CBS domains|nr:MAG: putative signal-transduction protein containing cAMP-binding and CBS domain protein [Halonotius sp. J07HN4]
MVEPTVTDVMTTPMLTLGAETPIDEAAHAMGEADIKSVVIVGKGCQPAGIFTSTDALEVLADSESPGEVTVKQYMTAPVETISPEMTLAAAADRMQQYSHLPVTDSDGDAIGILTKTDLAAAVANEEPELTATPDTE